MELVIWSVAKLPLIADSFYFLSFVVSWCWCFVNCSIRGGGRGKVFSLCFSQSRVQSYITLHLICQLLLHFSQIQNEGVGQVIQRAEVGKIQPHWELLSLFGLNIYLEKNELEIVLRCVSFVCNILKLHRLKVGLPGNIHWKSKFGHELLWNYHSPFWGNRNWNCGEGYKQFYQSVSWGEAVCHACGQELLPLEHWSTVDATN